MRGRPPPANVGDKPSSSGLVHVKAGPPHFVCNHYHVLHNGPIDGVLSSGGQVFDRMGRAQVAKTPDWGV